jgi:hypothetical protein
MFKALPDQLSLRSGHPRISNFTQLPFSSRKIMNKPLSFLMGSSLLAAGAVFSAAAPSYAGTLDLTTAGSSGTINDLYVQQDFLQPAGTGVINSFLRVQAQGNNTTEQGYNTDARPLEFDENNSPNFTRSLLLSDIPVIEFNGVLYREFGLDLNEQNNGNRGLIDLTDFELYLGDSGSVTNYNGSGFTGFSTDKIYDLDSNEDNTINLNASINPPGSGTADYFFYVEEDYFQASSFVQNGEDQTYVTLFSKFTDAGAGFEEWFVREGVPRPPEPPKPQPVPEPAAMAGLLAVGAGILVNRRKKAQQA